jgi:hypothetical protein
MECLILCLTFGVLAYDRSIDDEMRKLDQYEIRYNMIIVKTNLLIGKEAVSQETISIIREIPFF